ncbi:hypothetical protein FHS96_004962 [Sphingomonas zeicaulis]
MTGDRHSLPSLAEALCLAAMILIGAGIGALIAVIP